MEYGSYKMNKQKKFQLKLLFKFQKKEWRNLKIVLDRF